MLECPTCGTLLRLTGDPHLCEPHHGQHIRFNLSETDEERVLVSEGVRQIYSISEEFWYRNRPHDLEIVRRLRAQELPQQKGA